MLSKFRLNAQHEALLGDIVDGIFARARSSARLPAFELVGKAVRHPVVRAYFAAHAAPSLSASAVVVARRPAAHRSRSDLR